MLTIRWLRRRSRQHAIVRQARRGRRSTETASRAGSSTALRRSAGPREGGIDRGVTTDGRRPYLIAVREAFGADVDYAMLIKVYGSVGGDGAAHRRYGPGEMNGAERMIVSACRTPRRRPGRCRFAVVAVWFQARGARE